MAYRNQITSWSHSRLSDWTLCPAKAKYKHVMRMKEPPNVHMERGIRLHKLCEDYINSKITRMPPELKQFEKLFRALRAMRKKPTSVMAVETSWCFDKNWERCEWNDWDHCVVRIKVDLAYIDPKKTTTLRVKDWKSGRYNPSPEYEEQLKLYALGAFLMYPHVDEVVADLSFLDSGESHELVFKREQLKELMEYFRKRTLPMLRDTTFAPTPNDKCRWCHFRKDNNGPCKF